MWSYYMFNSLHVLVVCCKYVTCTWHLSTCTFTAFKTLHVTILAGWLLEPDSRPPFSDLVTRLNDLLQDPRRYILTVTDGLVEDYSNLPTNITASGEFTYENPFNLMASMQLSSIESVPPTAGVSNGTVRGGGADGVEGVNPYDNSDLFAENGAGDYDNDNTMPANSKAVTFTEVESVNYPYYN